MTSWLQTVLSRTWAGLENLAAAMLDNGRITQEQVRRVFP